MVHLALVAFAYTRVALAATTGLDSADARERLFAVRALAHDPTALEALSTALTKESDPALRSAIADAMERLPLGEDALIAALAGSSVSAARAFAAHALGRDGSQHAVNALLAAVSDGDPTVREHVYTALAASGHREALPTLMKAAVRETAFAPRGAAEKAAELLAASPTVPFDTPAALARLEHGNSDARIAAAHDLGEHGDRRAVDALCAAANGSTDVPLQRAAIAALGRLGDGRAVPTLVTLLPHTEGRTRQEAIGALAALRDESAADALTTLTRDADVTTRQLSVRALGWIAPPDLFDRLLTVQSDASEDVRGEVLFVAGESRDPARIAALRRGLADPSPFLRAGAGRIAGEAGQGPLLIPLLTDHDALVRLTAADGLAALAPEGAADALRAAAKRAPTADERTRMTEAANRVGEQLPGTPSGR